MMTWAHDYAGGRRARVRIVRKLSHLTNRLSYNKFSPSLDAAKSSFVSSLRK